MQYREPLWLSVCEFPCVGDMYLWVDVRALESLSGVISYLFPLLCFDMKSRLHPFHSL